MEESTVDNILNQIARINNHINKSCGVFVLISTIFRKYEI